MGTLSTNQHLPLLVGHGLTLGLETLTGFKFDPHSPYSGCRICGELFQADADRRPLGYILIWRLNLEGVLEKNLENRKQWSLHHAKQHPASAHRQLALSGRWCTPEAAHKFAAFGIISIIDLAVDQEVAAALKESSPIPTDDVEGS